MANKKKEKIGKPILYFVIATFLFSTLLIGSSFFSPQIKNILPNRKNPKSTNSFSAKSAPDNQKTSHFIVKGNVEKTSILSKGEEYYRSIPSLIGLSSEQILGMDKITINVFSSPAEYTKETGKPTWSEGFADYKNNEIFVVQSKDLLESILPHEISHLFFDSFMGFERDDFNWFDEGLATYVQVNFDSEQSLYFSDAMDRLRNGKAININDLEKLNLDNSTPKSIINNYYAQSLSLVDYLKTLSFDKWKHLLSELKSKKTFAKALLNSYGLTKNKLQAEWLKFIKNNKQSWEKITN